MVDLISSLIDRTTNLLQNGNENTRLSRVRVIQIDKDNFLTLQTPEGSSFLQCILKQAQVGYLKSATVQGDGI